MSTLSRTLTALTASLRTLPPHTPPHLQRLSIRVQRAHAAAQSATLDTGGLETLVRFRGRLEELVEGLDELQGALTEAVDVRRDAKKALEALDAELRTATSTAARAATGTGHARTPSTELPRRVPSSSSAAASTNADLDAFLSRSLPSPPPSASGREAEAAKALGEAYGLFLLSTSPSSVLPAGQSLKSTFHSTRAPSPPEQLEKRIETQLKQAYFDGFAEVFASGTSEEKSEAWRRLGGDIADAVGPLIPSRLKTASGTSQRAELEASLRAGVPGADALNASAALTTVHDAVSRLQRLCAPARDPDVQSLLSSLSSAASLPAAQANTSLVPLVRQTLELAAKMRDDVARFRRDAVDRLASEEDLRQVVREEGAAREKKAVLSMYGSERAVRLETVAWVVRALARPLPLLEEQEVKKADLAAALIACLFTDSAVGLPSLPSSSPSPTLPEDGAKNALPPPLLVLAPSLFQLQNRLQALVILACLVALVGPAPASTDEVGRAKETELVKRLWTILEGSIDPPPSPFVFPPSESIEETASTRLANLADELLAHRRTASLTGSLQEGEEKRVTDAVDRVLRYEDPVFKLLKGRLRSAVEAALLSSFAPPSSAPATPAFPATLRSGRALASSGPSTAAATAALPESTIHPPVKGFDRSPFLHEKLEEVVRDGLTGEKGIWGWVEEVWGAVLGWREADEGQER
ncbi:hypothetical protein JCM10213_001729 [Rhodosporidiobolus nylandii]